MPAALEYILDTSSQVYRDLEAAHSKEYRERASMFAGHWKFYDGDMPNPLKLEVDKVNDNLILPKVGQAIDKIVGFLVGQGLRFDAGLDDEDTEADEEINNLWLANRMNVTLHNMALTGALAGHNFARIEPRPGQQPRIVPLNPAHCSAFWALDDISHVLWYRLQYRLGNRGAGKRIDYVQGQVGDRSIQWRSQNDPWWELVYMDDGGQTMWKPVGEPKQLPWPFPPIVDWQNLPRPHEYYGADDVHLPIILNTNLNFLASLYSRIIKHHSAPKTVGIGFKAEALTATAVGGFFTVNEDKAKADVFNLEMQSDLSSTRALMEIIAAELWSSAQMVDPAAMKDKVGQLTNFGLRVLYTDAIRRTETKRLLYGEALSEISRRALVMSGQTPPERIGVVWPDILPTDDAEDKKAKLEELNAGVIDKQTYSEEVGRDWQKIDKRLQEAAAGEENLGSRFLTAFARGD